VVRDDRRPLTAPRESLIESAGYRGRLVVPEEKRRIVASEVERIVELE
jgi:hypothetical protein